MRVLYGFLPAIATERKVAEHFEKSQVRGIADFVNVRSAHAFLHRGRIFRAEIFHCVLVAGVISLELLHPRRGEKHQAHRLVAPASTQTPPAQSSTRPIAPPPRTSWTTPACPSSPSAPPPEARRRWRRSSPTCPRTSPAQCSSRNTSTINSRPHSPTGYSITARCRCASRKKGTKSPPTASGWPAPRPSGL